ncbi:MAG: AraC family transcriptional regulator [Phyllobacteriaceae bacterium]|nr:AraC family transcriptional regulator [Phyllobacteriaceae bacterium]
MLETAFLDHSPDAVDTKSFPIRSRDWSVIGDFCRMNYMPYDTIPLERYTHPDAIMYSTEAGRIGMTRFCYGLPVRLENFAASSGKVMVLTTLSGALRHADGRSSYVTTEAGESFVVDFTRRTDHWLDGDDRHLQFNLTIPKDLIELTAMRWLGFVPDDDLWTCRLKIGGGRSTWMPLLEHAVDAITRAPTRAWRERVGAHIEEALCSELLLLWADAAGVRLDAATSPAAPHYVCAAEDFMRTHAHRAPTIGEVADAVGVSVRSLSGGFRRFRNTTPGDFLREQRLNGVRDALASAAPNQTVASIVGRWGYANFGVFAQAYHRRFGELPSSTLRRSRRHPAPSAKSAGGSRF